MRVYIIGRGSIARRHMTNIAALRPDADFIVDRASVRQAPWLSDLGVALHAIDSVAEALALGPDAAVVCSATAAHIETLPALIDAGLPLYIEKPVVATRADLAVVTTALSRAEYRAPSLVGCNLRHLPSLVMAREICMSGRLGRIVRAQFDAGGWLPDWRPGRDYRASYSAHADQGGGVVLDLIHEFDAARWFLGEFSRVRADLGIRSTLELQAEDVAGALLSRPDGPLAVVMVDYISRRPVRRYSFVGEDGTLTWDLAARTLIRTDTGGVHVECDDSAAFDIGNTYVAAMTEFLGSVAEGGMTSQPIEEGLRSLDLALTVKEAGRP